MEMNEDLLCDVIVGALTRQPGFDRVSKEDDTLVHFSGRIDVYKIALAIMEEMEEQKE